MKIAFDISPLRSGHKVRGVGSYVRSLKAALEKVDDINSYQFFEDKNDIKNADLIHYPYFDPFTLNLSLRSNIPIVITIHDLIPLKFPKYFPVGIKGNAYWRINKRLLKNVAGIITDSHASTKDVIDLLGVDAFKISTVHLASDPSLQNTTPVSASNLRKKYDLPKEYALYVGDITWNKNVPAIIKACQKANVPLVLVGKALAQKEFDASHPWNRDLVSALQLSASDKNMHIIGFVTQEELVGLYASAKFLVAPSLYEGFGLPVVEAMSLDCPVITSKEGSLEEVGGNAVYSVDAKDIESISDGVAEVWNSKSLQNQLKKSGKIQANEFNWKKTALATIDAYAKCFS